MELIFQVICSQWNSLYMLTKCYLLCCRIDKIDFVDSIVETMLIYMWGVAKSFPHNYIQKYELTGKLSFHTLNLLRKESRFAQIVIVIVAVL